VRDIETARNAIKAADTGHLVIATLHTGSIEGAVARLRDIGVNAYELVDILRSVLVQRLVRKICTKCSGKGCPHCGGQGYRGRTIVSECVYLPDANAVKSVLDGQRSWQTIVEDAIAKARSGVTDFPELWREFGAEIEHVYQPGADPEASAKNKEQRIE
jgi:general secretion pathway protein E